MANWMRKLHVQDLAACTQSVMGRHVLWIGPAGSLLPQQVGRGVYAPLRLLPLGDVLPSAGDLSDACVVVLEPAKDGHGLEPSWLARLQSEGVFPLSLILQTDKPRYSNIDWLDAGADRCLPLRTDTEVMQAMIRALVHRCQGEPATYTEHGLLRFEHDTKTLVHPGGRVSLTSRETRVADVLFRQGTRYVRPEKIVQALCPDECLQRCTSQVSLYIHRINRKIQPYGLRIEYKRAYGYRLSLKVSETLRAQTNDGAAWASRHVLHSWWSPHANPHGPI